MSKRYLVLGMGFFGRELAVALTEAGSEVLAVDRNPKLIELVTPQVGSAAVADVRDKEALKELLASSFDGAVVAMGNSFESAILATLHLKELGVKEIHAEANDAEREDVLRRVGATSVLSPEREFGRKFAQKLSNPNLVEYIPLTAGYCVVESDAPGWAIGKTLGELAVRNRFELAVIAIRDSHGVVAVVPGAEAAIREGDQLTLVGRDADVKRFHDHRP